MWHGTSDTLLMTSKMWHLTYDTGHMTHRLWWIVCENFWSLALTVWERLIRDMWHMTLTRDMWRMTSPLYIPLTKIELFGVFQSFLSPLKVPSFCWNYIYTVICSISEMSQTPDRHKNVKKRGNFALNSFIQKNAS